MTTRWQRASALLRPQHDEAPVVEEAPGLTLAQVVRRFWPDLRPYSRHLLLGLGLLAAASGPDPEEPDALRRALSPIGPALLALALSAADAAG